ncbi:MAG: DUF285 domain-containing protein, partial [Eubacteriaceae bacterium]|nr:DUF285 domain-containing protein [Eubacteriaceae bacterium]
MKKKITSVLIILLCALMAVPWGVFAQAVNAEKNAENTQQQTTAPAPTPTPEQPAETSAEPRDEAVSTLADYPEGRAVLDTGKNVNEAVKKLSGGFSDSYGYNIAISAILRSNSPAPAGITTKNLSISDVPVTAWWDANSQTIYWYSEDEKPMLNSNSGYMFSNFKILIDLDVSQFDTSNVHDMDSMFSYCSALSSLDVSHFDTSKVTNMRKMFESSHGFTNLDLSNFDTSNVTDMKSMFGYCSNLTELDLSNFDTSKVTNMSGMFSGCSSLTELDLLSFDTSKVTNMDSMFSGCSSMTEIDLSNFDTSKVTGMFGMLSMFGGCIRLKTIYTSDKFSTVNVQSHINIFYGSSALVGGNGTRYDIEHIDKVYARIDKPGQPGYFTEKESSVIPTPVTPIPTPVTPTPVTPIPTPVTPTPNPAIEPFEWGVDNFSFKNRPENFYRISETLIPVFKPEIKNFKTYRTLINGRYQNVLKSKLSPKEYNYIFESDSSHTEARWIDIDGNLHYEPLIDHPWVGVCQGMSALVLLGKAGMVPYSEYGGSSIHSLPIPIYKDDLRSLIAYYQVLQSTDWNTQSGERTRKRSHKTNINNILEGLKQRGIVLVSYGWSDGAHAVIAYGEGEGRTIDGKTYDKCIKICDPNENEENSDCFIYYDSNTYEWIIPIDKKFKSSAGAKINDVQFDPIMVNYQGYLGSTVKTNADDATDNDNISLLEDEPYIARLEIYQGNVSGIKKVTKDSNGNYVEKADQGDGSDIVKNTFYAYCGESKGTAGYTLDDAETAYQVTQDTVGPMELVMDYENTLYHVRAEKAKSIIFDKNGFVSVDADQGNCAVEMTSNTDNPTDWFTNYAKTTDATKLSMTKTTEGYEVVSDNLNDTKVLASNKEETKEENVSTQKDKMIICETKKDLDVKVDNTGDGIYETSIVNKDKPSDTGHEGSAGGSGGSSGGGGGDSAAKAKPTKDLYTMTPAEAEYTGKAQTPTITPAEGAGEVDKVHYDLDGKEITGEP